MDYSKDSNNKRRKRANSQVKKVRNKTGVLIFRIILSTLIIAGFAFVGVCFGAWMGIIENAPKLDTYFAVQSKNYTSIVYDQNGVEIDRFNGAENREYISFDKIPINLKNAYVAIEDERFYSHNGIDLKGIVRSVYTTVFQDNKQGASTLTQQLIKNNIANIQRNTLETKIQEQYLAVKYENLLEDKLGSKELAKDYIFEDYLNTIGLDHGLNGVQTASKYYFNKDVSELNLPECAVIASITQSPKYLSPDDNQERNRERQLHVLNKMLELGFITQAEHDEAVNYPVYEGLRPGIHEEQVTKIHDYFSDALIEQVVTDLEGIGYSRSLALQEIYNGGLKIYTTQDVSMQKTLETAFSDDAFFPSWDYEIDVIYNLSVQSTITGEPQHYEEKTTVKNQEEVDAFIISTKDRYLTSDVEFVAEKKTLTIQPQAAMIIIDYHNGQVKAIVGGRGKKETNRGFNRATQSKRQPGSVFKVLASFAPAIDLDKIGAGSVINDEPFYLPSGQKWPNNWTGSFKGPVTIREAIYNSMNVVTVRNMDNTGVDNCFNYLLRFQFTTLVDALDENNRTDRGLATALGGITYGVTQLEVTAAYGTIANNGIYQKPTFYTKILDHNGQILLEYKPEQERKEVLKSTTSYILTDMMKDVLTRGTGGKARFKSVKMPIAGKTGTSQNTKDLTFVGYTPYYVAGIWLGYDKEKVINEDRGYHMLLWSHVMEQIHQDLEYKDFEKPNGITTATLCLDSGKIAVPGLCNSDSRGNRTVTDIFAVGGTPTELCDVHASVIIDTLTGQRANASTPPERRQLIIGPVRGGGSGGGSNNETITIPESMLTENDGTKINDNNPTETSGNEPGDNLITIPTISPSPSPSPELPSFPTLDDTLISPSPDQSSPPPTQSNEQNSSPPPSDAPSQAPQQPQFSDVPEYTTTPQQNTTESPKNNGGATNIDSLNIDSPTSTDQGPIIE